MPFFSDTRETLARYGRYIAEFQELCKQHDVGSGTPEEFYRLAPKLAYDEAFRSAFSTLTRSVAQREDGRLTLTRILTIIAIAVAGDTIDTIGTAGAVPVSLVVVFLAGVGGWSEEESSEAPVPEPIKAASLQSMATNEQQNLLDDEREALELERRLAADPEPNDLQNVAASLFGNPALVKEALGRLELHTLELKLHLDSIDSRMERIEPHLDDLTSRLSTAEPPRRLENELHTRSQLPVLRYSQPALRIAQAPPAPTEPESSLQLPEIAPAKLQPPDNLQVAPIDKNREPKNAHELRRLYRLLSVLAALLIVMASVLGFLLYGNYGRVMKGEVGRILSGVRGDTTVKTIVSAADGGNSFLPSVNAATPKTEPELPVLRKIEHEAPVLTKQKPVDLSQGGAATQRKVFVQSGFGEAAKKINIDRPKEEELPKAPAIHLADALPDAIAGRLSEGSSMRLAASESTASNASSGASVTYSAGGDKEAMKAPEARTKVFVPASSMVRTAIASPPPIYPATARTAGIEGEVVLQALISEKGMVESVSVVSGPTALQNAAVEALRRWKFKPYLVDGHPVAVRTFVDFRFKMTY
jgi:TonB family protein